MPLKRSCATVVLALLAACGTDTPSTAPETTTPISTPCVAPQLEPSSLPEDVEPTDREPYFGQPERTRTWAGDEVVVQIGEGFSGDHGEDPQIRRVNVRGNPNGRLVPMKAPDGTSVIVVDWDEETRCGVKQYLVVTEGPGEEETLDIAQSLEGDTK